MFTSTFSTVPWLQGKDQPLFLSRYYRDVRHPFHHALGLPSSEQNSLEEYREFVEKSLVHIKKIWGCCPQHDFPEASKYAVTWCLVAACRGASCHLRALLLFFTTEADLEHQDNYFCDVLELTLHYSYSCSKQMVCISPQSIITTYTTYFSCSPHVSLLLFFASNSRTLL